MTRFVVAVDGSEGSLVALRWAVEEAEVHGAQLAAVHAWSWLDQPEDSEFKPSFGEDDARAELERALATGVGERAAGIERVVICDVAADAIVSAGEGADLVIVGARGHGGFAGLRLGSVSERVLEHSATPVAVIHESGPVRGGRVVVGYDGSANARQAVQWAAREAAARGAVLTLVQAWTLPVAMATPFDGLPDIGAYEQAERVAYEEILADPTLEGVELDGRFVAGNASRAVLELAEGAGVVVVGSRGRSRLASVLLGSTSRQVVRHAPCPVVVLRSPH
jgi:nucleotide-binding universal stress UspA family protein